MWYHYMVAMMMIMMMMMMISMTSKLQFLMFWVFYYILKYLVTAKIFEYCYVLSKFVVIRYVVLFHLIVLYRSSRVFLQPWFGISCYTNQTRHSRKSFEKIQLWPKTDRWTDRGFHKWLWLGIRGTHKLEAPFKEHSIKDWITDRALEQSHEGSETR